jgi:hypothetical protein
LRRKNERYRMLEQIDGNPAGGTLLKSSAGGFLEWNRSYLGHSSFSQAKFNGTGLKRDDVPYFEELELLRKN